MKKFPSCDIEPIAYWVLNCCETPLLKLWAKRHVVPLPSDAIAIISLYQGAGKVVRGLQVVDANGTLSAGSTLFHD